MKKFAAFALLLSLSMLTIGCKPAEKKATPEATPTTEPAPTETPAEPAK